MIIEEEKGLYRNGTNCRRICNVIIFFLWQPQRICMGLSGPEKGFETELGRDTKDNGKDHESR